MKMCVQRQNADVVIMRTPVMCWYRDGLTLSYPYQKK